MKRAVLSLLLAGCPTLDVGDTPVEPPLCRPNLDKFQEAGGIWDTALAPADPAQSCVARDGCHAIGTGRSALRLIYKPRDQMTSADFSTNLDTVARFLNCSTPAASLLITKPEAGTESHLGGDLWTCTSSTCEPIKTVEAWIEGK
jgi:hypothetical protein